VGSGGGTGVAQAASSPTNTTTTTNFPNTSYPSMSVSYPKTVKNSPPFLPQFFVPDGIFSKHSSQLNSIGVIKPKSLLCFIWLQFVKVLKGPYI
jgi:hypothetical protein